MTEVEQLRMDLAALANRLAMMEAEIRVGQPFFAANERDAVSSVTPTGDGASVASLASFDATITGPTVSILYGYVQYQPRGPYLAATTVVTIASTNPDAPTYVYVQMPKTGTLAATIITNETLLQPNDTHWNWLIYAYYLDDSNTATLVHDYRPDIHMGAPIR